MGLRMILFSLAGYLSGSVMYSYYIPKLLTGGDVRTQNDDCNPGAANAFRLCGPAVGIFCAMLDVLKAAVPVYASIVWGGIAGWALVPVALSPVLGHAYPATLKFKGGKAIASMFGALLGLWPVTHAVLLLAAIVLLLLPILHNHAMLMFTSLCAFASLTILLVPAPPIRFIAGGLLVVVGSRHVREANAALEEAKDRIEREREARKAA